MRLLFLLFISFSCLIVYGQFDQFKRERVSIKNGEHAIDGLLLMPETTMPSPALIFFGGSGEWEIADSFLKDPKESYGNFLSFYFHDYLVKQGGAVLLLNKRGLGKSSGTYGKTTLEDRASDGLAALNYLYNDARIDQRRIFLVGHSQGGWVVQQLASDLRIAGAISFAGPTVGVKQQTITDYRNQFDCEYGKGSRKSKRKLRHKRNELALGAVIGKMLGGSAGEYARIHRYSNEQALRGIRKPTLLLFGEKDLLVPPQENIDHLKTLFDHHVPAVITTWTLPNLNHAFREVDSPCTGYMESLQMPESKELKEKLEVWLNDLLQSSLQSEK